MLSNGMRGEICTTLIRETVPRASRLTQKRLIQNNSGGEKKKIKRELTACGYHSCFGRNLRPDLRGRDTSWKQLWSFLSAQLPFAKISKRS